MDAGDCEPLRSADAASMAASLRRLFETEEAFGADFDGDRLARAASSMSIAGQTRGPHIAMAWLAQRPDPLRLAMVLSFLMVAWQRTEDGPGADPSLVSELQAIHDRLPQDLIIENKLLVVLAAAARTGLPATLQAAVRARLAAARDTPGRQPEMRMLLDAYLGEIAN